LDSALRKTASALDVDLPSAPNAAQQAIAARYQAASGSSFDSLFISTQMDSHMAAMTAGQTELSRGSDTQAKTVARNAAPVIASHHSALNDAAQSLGVPSRIDTGTGGQAAHRAFTGPVTGLLTLGVLLLIAGA